MQRYFINSDILSIDETVVITGDDFHHIKNVMRMKVNDKVFLSTNNNDSYIGVISNITNDSIEIVVCEILENKTELNSFVVIAQGLVRREKTEEVVKHITELVVIFKLRWIEVLLRLKIILKMINLIE